MSLWAKIIVEKMNIADVKENFLLNFIVQRPDELKASVSAFNIWVQLIRI